MIKIINAWVQPKSRLEKHGYRRVILIVSKFRMWGMAMRGSRGTPKSLKSVKSLCYFPI